jgi:hypothetical protein
LQSEARPHGSRANEAWRRALSRPNHRNDHRLGHPLVHPVAVEGTSKRPLCFSIHASGRHITTPDCCRSISAIVGPEHQGNSSARAGPGSPRLRPPDPSHSDPHGSAARPSHANLRGRARTRRRAKRLRQSRPRTGAAVRRPHPSRRPMRRPGDPGQYCAAARRWRRKQRRLAHHVPR